MSKWVFVLSWAQVGAAFVNVVLRPDLAWCVIAALCLLGAALQTREYNRRRRAEQMLRTLQAHIAAHAAANVAASAEMNKTLQIVYQASQQHLEQFRSQHEDLQKQQQFLRELLALRAKEKLN